MPPPREGVRSRPRRAAGPQRQGPHCGLRARLERQPRQHRGPITRAFLDVLQALLWGFHNSRSGCCFPSYEAIAVKAECARSTVAEALKALEWAGVLTWQHRITRILVRERDLLGQWASCWRVIRTRRCGRI
jgi:Helix-turn-helix domain